MTTHGETHYFAHNDYTSKNEAFARTRTPVEAAVYDNLFRLRKMFLRLPPNCDRAPLCAARTRMASPRDALQLLRASRTGSKPHRGAALQARSTVRRVASWRANQARGESREASQLR